MFVVWFSVLIFLCHFLINNRKGNVFTGVPNDLTR